MMQPGCNKEIGKANVFLARRFIIQRMKELKNKKGFKSFGSLLQGNWSQSRYPFLVLKVSPSIKDCNKHGNKDTLSFRVFLLYSIWRVCFSREQRFAIP